MDIDDDELRALHAAGQCLVEIVAQEIALDSDFAEEMERAAAQGGGPDLLFGLIGKL